MYTTVLIPAAIGAAVILGSSAYAAPIGEVSVSQEHLYYEYQKDAHAHGLDRWVVRSADTAPQGAAERTRSFDRAPAAEEMVNIGGRQMPASAVIGRPVVTPTGERLGQVARTAGQGSPGSEIIIRIDDENHQMSVGTANPAKLPAKAANEPVVVGTTSAVVSGDRLRQADDGQALVIERSSFRPIDRKYT